MATTKASHSRCPTCQRKYKRSNPQNRLYWELLHMLAARVNYPADTLHLYYRSRFLGADDVTLPNGKTLTIPRSTADLDVAEFGEYFDRVQADAAERGVFLADLD